MGLRSLEMLEGRLLLSGDLDLAIALGAAGVESCRAVGTDGRGNIYLAGAFSRSMYADQAKRTLLRSAGSGDAFVAKYAPNGSLLWIRQFGGTGKDVAAAIAVNPAGGVIVAGSFSNSSFFSPTRQRLSRGNSDIFVISLSNSGGTNWLYTGGGTGADRVGGVALDNGSLYVTGSFQGAFPVKKRLQLTSAGGSDAFLMRLSAATGAIGLATRSGGPGDDVGTAVATQSGRAIVTGTFSDTATFGGKVLQSRGGRDAFVAVAGHRGQGPVDALAIGGAGDDVATSVAVDSAGGFWVAGSYSGDVDFDPSDANTVLHSVNGTPDAFAAKYDWTAGPHLLDAKTIGGAGTDSARDIALDSGGAIYIAGSFQQTADMDPGGGVSNSTSAGASDGFLVKLSAAGRFGYARTYGGLAGDAVRSIALSPGDQVILGGAFAGTADVSPAGPVQHLVSRGATDAFAMRLTQSDASFSLARTFGTSGDKLLNSIAIDMDGFLYLVGTYNGTISFGSGPGAVQFTSSGGTDIFVGKFCNKCNIQWGRSFGGIGDDSAADVAIDDAGNVWATGTFQGDVSFGPTSLTSAGGSDIFLLKLDSQGNTLDALAMGGAEDDRAVAIEVSGARTNLLGQIGSSGTSNPFLWSYADGDLQWSTQLGADGLDTATSLAIDDNGNNWVVGASRDGDGRDQLAVWRVNADGQTTLHREYAFSGGSSAQGITTSSDGGVYVAGKFAGRSQFAASPALVSAGGDDGLVLRLDADGKLVSSFAFGGVGDDVATAIAADVTGRVYVTGSFSSSMEIDLPGHPSQLNSTGGSDVLAIRLTADLRPTWVGAIGGSGDDRATSAVADSSGTFFYILGSFATSANLDPTGGTFPASGTALEAFLTRVVF